MFVIARILFFLHLFQTMYSSPSLDSGRCTSIFNSNLCVWLGSKYYLVDGSSRLNWFEAERFCRRQNGFLATIENANELRSISDYLSLQHEESDWFWISGNDLGSEGIFFSISSGKLLPFTAWIEDQPDNWKGNENCVHLVRKPNGFEMNDLSCEEKSHIICELDTSSEQTIFEVPEAQ